MASQTNAEKLYSEINVLLFDVCQFLTSAVRSEELSPRVKNEAQNLVLRSKEKVDAIAKMQKEVLRVEVDTSNAIDDEFPHHDLAPWDLPQCSAKYGPLVTNERIYLIGPKKTVFVALVDCYLLFYKINKKNEGPSDWINVMDYTATALENRKDFAFEITARGKQRFEFMARSSKDVNQWLAAIKYKKQPVVISNISESILESNLGEYWEVEEIENEQPKPLQFNNFTHLEQSSTLSSGTHQSKSFSAYNNNNNDIIVDEKYFEEEPEYYTVIETVETNRANASLKRFEDIQHLPEQVPSLPDRSKTNSFHLKNKKLYGLSNKFDDVSENQIIHSVSYNGQSSGQKTLTKQSSYLHSQNFRPDKNMAEPENNFHNFVQPGQPKELFQDTLPRSKSINVNDLSTKAAVSQELNEPKEITGNQYKHSISLTNTQSSTSSSSLSSWGKELHVHVLSRQISANNNKTTVSNQLKSKPEVPVKPSKVNSVKHSSISQEPDEIQNVEEPKTFQQIRENMEHWLLNQKN